LDGLNLACFDSACPVKFRVFELFIELIKSFVIIGFIFLVFHFQTQHEILAHFRIGLRGLNIFHQMVNLMVGFFDVSLKGLEIVFVHNFLLSEGIDLLLEFVDISHSFVVPFVILRDKIKQLRYRFVFEDFSFW
jgi:hypothetical protein